MDENIWASSAPVRSASIVAEVLRERSRRATINSALDRLAATGGTIEVDLRGWSAQIPSQQVDVTR
ncbi:hypothetical protein [Amycolatopsis sp. NPDC003861]